VQHYDSMWHSSFCVMSSCHVFSFVGVLLLSCFILSLLADYIKQCCSFKTWPLRLPYTALGTWREKRYWLSVLTHGFIECYGDVRGTNKERLCGRSKLGGIAPDTCSLVFPFSGLAPSHNLRFLMISMIITYDFCDYDLMPFLKILHTPLSEASKKFFQSGPALAKAGPGLDQPSYWDSWKLVGRRWRYQHDSWTKL